ncbi:MAG: HD domain-containing protein, partial [Bacteroidaceae bacterium]|nr:HD domain-containing protein [Bacteroidaceae bacterium]
MKNEECILLPSGWYSPPLGEDGRGLPIYHHSIPSFIQRIAATPAMQRLDGVGMNCGCEYTNFPRFRNIRRYTRYEHSIGVGLIVWHFTHDIQQSIAALLHDIATPTFAHVIDFLHGDYEKQETTEEHTLEMISLSSEIVEILHEYSLQPIDVADYHLYPIADNDTPQISADRLEYTLGNIITYHLDTLETVQQIYQSLIVGKNEHGVPELMFSTLANA